MYRVMIEDSFSAAHKLPDTRGKCSNLHGHNFRVQVFFEKEKLDENGMVIDFRIVKDALRDVLSLLDHTFLNERPEFTFPPTSENIAQFIFRRLSEMLGIWLSEVRVWENENVFASFRESLS